MNPQRFFWPVFVALLAATTLAGSDPADKPIAAPADWPDDWRAKLADHGIYIRKAVNTAGV